MTDRCAQLREGGRTAHEQTQQAQTLLAREHANARHRVDVTDLFHERPCGPLPDAKPK